MPATLLLLHTTGAKSGQPRIPAIPARQQARHIVGQPVQGQEQRVARNVRRTNHRIGRTVVPNERRSDIEIKCAAAQRDVRRRAVERHGESERLREQHGRHRRGTGLVGDRDAGLTARRRDQDLLRNQGGQEQKEDHDRLPFTTRAISRSATRRFRSSRLSCAFFAFASAIATLARPSLK